MQGGSTLPIPIGYMQGGSILAIPIGYMQGGSTLAIPICLCKEVVLLLYL